MIKKLAFFLLFLCTAMGVSAHPHVWVDTKLVLLSEKGHITGVRVSWGFDEFYSTIFMTEADTNGNKTLDPEEIQSSINAVFQQEQKELYPFFFMKPGGVKKPFTLRNADVFMKDGTLFYKFDVIFDQPQPLKGEHHIGIYDPEFYVNFEQDLKIQLPEGVSCSQKLAENKDISIYFDMINPETYTLHCT